MGNDQSNLASLSTEDVASAVAAKGSTYEPYAQAVRDNGVDGELIASLGDDSTELEDIFEELSINSKLHRKVLTNSLREANNETQEGSHSASEKPHVVENAAYFRAAEALNLNVDTPAADVEEFDKIAVKIMEENARAQYAGVNMILSDAQHPISARIRQPDGIATVSDRRLANVSHEDSVCYYLVHDPNRDSLILDLPEGNPFGSTYVGYVVKDRDGNRVGAVCQVTDVEDETDANEQIMLLQQLAEIAEEQIEERRALQSRAHTLKQQVVDLRTT